MTAITVNSAYSWLHEAGAWRYNLINFHVTPEYMIIPLWSVPCNILQYGKDFACILYNNHIICFLFWISTIPQPSLDCKHFQWNFSMVYFMMEIPWKRSPAIHTTYPFHPHYHTSYAIATPKDCGLNISRVLNIMGDEIHPFKEIFIYPILSIQNDCKR